MAFSQLQKVLHDSCGNTVHCKSQDALDRFNEGLLKYVRSYGDSMASFEEALKLDSEFLLVNCTLGTLWLSALRHPNDPLVATHMDAVKRFSLEQLLPREKFHVDAFKSCASGDLPAACDHWVKCTVDHPRDYKYLSIVAERYFTVYSPSLPGEDIIDISSAIDALAIRQAFIGHLMLGQFQKMRDNLSSILIYWSKKDELYPFILSLYSFALEETGRYDEAEAAAQQSLSINTQSPWATHALSHVIEEDRDVKEGVQFLTSTREQWNKSGLGNHIAWHLCLYYIDLDEMDTLLKEYDSNLVKNVTPGNLFGLLDASSLLWRLECLGVDVGDRWTKVRKCFKSHLDNRALVWYDTHLMMTLAHGTASSEPAAKFALAEHLIKSLQDYAQSGRSTDCAVAEMVGVPVCQALLAYGKQQYDEVVSLLVPLRYDIVRFGGSWAQRQVFSVTFIQAAIKSGQLKLALSLIAELKAVKPKNRRLPILFDEVKKMIES